MYLRSFDDDKSGARAKGTRTEEEHLASVLSQIGPFVAVGRPQEATPELGATRIYLEDTAWQATVESLIQRAALVVLRTGTSVGVLWELQQSLRVLSPNRFILLVDNRQDLATCLTHIDSVHPQARKSLPLAWRPIGSIRAIVAFDDRWQAVPLPLESGFLFHARHESLAGVRLQRALEPVFKRLDVDWRRPRPNHMTRMVVILAGAMLAIGVGQGFGDRGTAIAMIGGATFVAYELLRAAGTVLWLERRGAVPTVALLALTLVAAGIAAFAHNSLSSESIVTVGILGVSLGGTAIPNGFRLMCRHGPSSPKGLFLAASLLSWVLSALTISTALADWIAQSDAAWELRKKERGGSPALGQPDRTYQR